MLPYNVLHRINRIGMWVTTERRQIPNEVRIKNKVYVYQLPKYTDCSSNKQTQLCINILAKYANARNKSLSTMSLQWRQMSSKTSGHLPLDCFLISIFVQADIKGSIKAPHQCLFWGETAVTDGFPHKGPMMRKVFPRHDVVMAKLAWMMSYKF